MTSRATVGGGDRRRLFCALRLPEDVVDALVTWQRAELSGSPAARAVPRENLHVTLAFLGRRPEDDVPTVAEALRQVVSGAERPVLAPARYRETRSVGMLVLDDASGRATALASDLHRRLEERGVYQPESRQWLPHLTVLRFRERPRLQAALPELGAFSPSEAAVYHSLLRPGGAQYEVLESVALGR